MRRRAGWLLGSVGVAAAAAYRIVRRKKRAPATPDEPDPRADELRQKLEESRDLVSERDEFEEAETPVDRAEPAGVDERRKAVHEHARDAIEEMRSTEEPPG